jgi:ABC-type nitrate/sulfonate/bicarbonate transport system permease component
MRVPRFFLTSVLIVALLAIVEAGVRTRVINPLFVAPPSDAIGGAVGGLFDGTLGGPLVVTLYETGVCLVLATVLGVGAGYLLWRYGGLGRAFEPWVAGLFAAPLILLYPIPLVIFGRTPTAVIAQATVMALPPVILYTRQSLAAIPPQFLKVAAAFRLTQGQAMRHVLGPAAAPTLFTGLRLGLTYILVGVISVEYLAEIDGLGKTISFDYLAFDMPGVYSAVVLVFVLAAVLLAAIGRLQAVVRR